MWVYKIYSFLFTIGLDQINQNLCCSTEYSVSHYWLGSVINVKISRSQKTTPGVLKIFQVNRSLKFIPNFPEFHLKSPTKPQNIHNFWEQFCKYLVEEWMPQIEFVNRITNSLLTRSLHSLRNLIFEKVTNRFRVMSTKNYI